MTFNLFDHIDNINASYARIHGLLPSNVVPMPTKCKHCGHVYVGTRCTVCKKTQQEE